MAIKRRIRAGVAVAFLTALMAAPTPALGDQGSGLVLRRDGSKAVPFVTVTVPAAAHGTNPFDWGDAGIGAVSGAAAVLLAAAGGRAVRRGHSHSPSDLATRLTSGGKV
jgi:hypothetical protein